MKLRRPNSKSQFQNATDLYAPIQTPQTIIQFRSIHANKTLQEAITIILFKYHYTSTNSKII
jgi:hypothetical protein